jgi:CheY-like chemotaxis protein
MPRILRAEDDDVVRDMLQAVLERDGFEVVAVANIREALSIAAGAMLSHVEPGSRSAWPGCITSLPTQARDTLPFFVLSLRSGSWT